MLHSWRVCIASNWWLEETTISEGAAHVVGLLDSLASEYGSLVAVLEELNGLL